MTPTSKKIALICVGIVCAVVVLLGYLNFKGLLPFTLPFMNSTTVSQDKLNEAFTVHANRDYDASVVEFEDLVAKSANPEEKAILKTKLAVNLLGKGFAESEYNDTVKAGIDMLWAVGTDATIPASVRASALTDLGNTFSVHGNEFYMTYATPSPFNTFLLDKNEISGSIKASLKVFKYANELYPNAYSEFSMVRMYTNMLTNTTLEPGMTEKQTAELVQKYIADGDAHLLSGGSYPAATHARMMLDRAKGFGLTGRILQNNTLAEREEAFKLALESAQIESDKNKYAKDVEMETRFWYAGFLLIMIGEARNDDAIALVKPFGEGATPADSYVLTRVLFINLTKQPYVHDPHKRALAIAKVSPEFKSFLISVGWKI